jgi:hypothetical protein
MKTTKQFSKRFSVFVVALLGCIPAELAAWAIKAKRNEYSTGPSPFGDVVPSASNSENSGPWASNREL